LDTVPIEDRRAREKKYLEDGLQSWLQSYWRKLHTRIREWLRSAHQRSEKEKLYI